MIIYECLKRFFKNVISLTLTFISIKRETRIVNFYLFAHLELVIFCNLIAG